MTIHTETEIYRTAYDLLQVATSAARNMPRDVKQLVWRKMQDELLEAFDHIYLANKATDKVPHIEAVYRSIMRVELLLRQSVDMGFIKRPPYAQAVALTRSVAKQAIGWRKYSASHAPAA